MSDLISVIVPIYKVEQYLNKCVESIARQTYSNLEIILVDDGSPDRCGEICDEWAEKDSRIKVIHKKNGGLSDARNAGMKIASGDYIAFVDSDDWVENDYIRILYNSLKNNNARMSACDIRFVYENNDNTDSHEPTNKEFVCTSEEALSDILGGRGFRAVAWNKLYKADLLEGESFEVGRYHEDEFFTYRIIDKAERLVYVDTVLYYYLQRNGSIMSEFSVKHLDVLDAYMQRIELMQKKYPELYKRDKATFCKTCANFYCEALKYSCSEAYEIIKKARKSIGFSFSEITSYNIRDIIYIICTAVNIDLFAKILNKKRMG